MKKRLLLFLILILYLPVSTFSQDKTEIYSFAFYNVENLFDYDKDSRINDEEFTSAGAKNWTKEKYHKKLTNLSYVIDQLGKEISPKGLAILGLAEVENRRVLEDLIKTGEMAKKKYKIVHYDSPDLRGIDVALLYDSDLFQFISSKVYPYSHPDETGYKTRDQLIVSGILGGEKIHVIVVHWPSRLGNQSSELREGAAAITRHIADSLYQKDKDAKIVIMGDMNDDPVDKSCRLVLKAKRYPNEVKAGGLYNPMWNLSEKGLGTSRYKGKWNLFDQLIVSESLLSKNNSGLVYHSVEIFNRDFLIQQSGRYKGYPLRTFSGNVFLNGYSDHFPVILYLEKNK